MSNSTQAWHQISGTSEYKSNGLINIFYQKPTPDTKCASNKSCPQNPSYASKCLSIYYMWNVTMLLSEKLHLVSYVLAMKQTRAQISKQCSSFWLHSWNNVLNSWLHQKQGTDGEMTLNLHHTAHMEFIHENRIATNMKGTPKHLGDLTVPETLCPPSWRIKWLGVRH
jgi:hypothetical protein